MARNGSDGSDGSDGSEEHFGRGKTRFDEIYDRPDPRDYFTVLRRLGYQTPRHAQAVFRRLVRARGAAPGPGGEGAVLDLCCSYGINAALLNHELTLDDLYARYTSADVAGLSTEQLVESDRAFYGERRRPGAARVIGVDAAGRAVGYARAAGLLDEAFAVDLETAPPGDRLRTALSGTALITVTGGVGYVFTRTFERLVDAAPGTVWIAAFVLRTVPYRPVADALSERGLVTEKLHDRTFPQRRFTDERERRGAVQALIRAGMDVSGKEADGYYHTELFLSRPAKQALELPLDRLVGDTPRPRH